MDIQVVEKKEIKVVGISWSGTYSQTKTIPTLFTELSSRLEEVPHQSKEAVMIAPYHSRETEFTYYVTTPVDKIEDVPDGMIGFTIPRKNYVKATHIGGAESVDRTYKQIFTWMKEYGYEQDHFALSMEVYKEEHKDRNLSGDLHFDIYLPVKQYKDI